MSLQIVHLIEADIPEFVDLHDQALGNDPYLRAMLSNGQSARDFITEVMHKQFQQDDGSVRLKIVDTETNQMVAAAIWEFHLEPEQSIDQEEAQSDREEEKPSNTTEAFKAARRARLKEFNAKFIGKQANASLFLLCTHADHRRRGAASMLLKWGCDKADEYGIITVLHATPDGFQLYSKNGFDLVEELHLDLRPYGGNETVVRRAMIRQPKMQT